MTSLPKPNECAKPDRGPKHDWRCWYVGDAVYYQCKRCGKKHKF